MSDQRIAAGERVISFDAFELLLMLVLVRRWFPGMPFVSAHIFQMRIIFQFYLMDVAE
jgi:hypothetical protein